MPTSIPYIGAPCNKSYPLICYGGGTSDTLVRLIE